MKKKIPVICTILLFLISIFTASFILPKKSFAANTWTITTIDSVGSVGYYTSLALGDDGFARISYSDNTNGDLKFVQCTNTDCSTNNITTVDSIGNVGYYTSIALGDDGFARISYRDNTNGNLKFVQCTNADCSTNNITTVDSTGSVEHPSLALGDDGFARISYYDNSNTDLKFVQCTNADCSTNNITTVDSTGSVGRYTSIALGDDGFARISYQDVTNADLKFVQCTNADCSTNNIATVDSTGSVGYYNSLAIGDDGFARISYPDAFINGNLKFVQCTNADCSTNNITTVDSVGSDYNSLAIGDDGFARISYRDVTNTDLKFVQCTNADCSTNNIATVDSVGNEGWFNSLAIGDDGFARISYYDGDLKFALEVVEPTPTPTVQPSNNNGNTSSNSSSSPAPTCGDSIPTGTPDLFQIDVNNTQAILYFAPVPNANNYFIAYGEGQNTEVHGVQFDSGVSTGVLAYTVNLLQPNTTYSFKVRSGNGCMPGNWGNIMEVKSRNTASGGTTFYKNFISRILSIFPQQITNAGSGSSQPVTLNTNSCEYTVKSGDSLWNISAAKYGIGTKYNSIMQENNLPSALIHTGQALKVGC